eukprot:2235061-Prymnesium_polylepis.1
MARGDVSLDPPPLNRCNLFRRVRAEFARIRDRFTQASPHGFATAGFAQVRTSSQGFAPDITQFRETANARRCGVTCHVTRP